MWYFICLSAGACVGFVVGAMLAAGGRADAVTDLHAISQHAAGMDRANGVLRRELAELRAIHEAPRNHGYGASNGKI